MGWVKYPVGVNNKNIYISGVARRRLKRKLKKKKEAASATELVPFNNGPPLCRRLEGEKDMDVFGLNLGISEAVVLKKGAELLIG